MRGDDGRGGGVERGDGVQEPRAKKAQRTLTVIIAILMVLLFGIAYLAKLYRVMPMDPDNAGYQSLLSLLVTAVFGRGWFYFLTMGSVLLALALEREYGVRGFSAAGAGDCVHDYLPHVFILRGRRLLFSHGIYALTGFTAVILILFDGVTDRLIPLYAIGAFLAFTLSQAGMVVHWQKGRGIQRPDVAHVRERRGCGGDGADDVRGAGGEVYGGRWVTALLVPVLIGIMLAVKRHYSRVNREMKDMTPLNLVNLQEPIVVIPMARWDRITEKAMRFGLLMSKEIKVVHVHSDDDNDEGLAGLWDDKMMAPIRKEGLPEPELVTIDSSYRFILGPLMDYILELEDRRIRGGRLRCCCRSWWCGTGGRMLLHGQRVQLLKLMLLLKGNQRIVVINIPWYL